MTNLYFSADIESRDALQKRFEKGELKRVRKGIYVDTDSLEGRDEAILKGWVKIAKFLFDDPIAVYRTAAELKPHEGRVFLMVPESIRRTVEVGPLKLTIENGVTVQGVEPFDMDMLRSNFPRIILENLSLSRERSGVKKTLGKDWVESKLFAEVAKRGEDGLNQVRDEAAQLAPILSLKKEYKLLNKIISAILTTHMKKGILQARVGIAFADGEPFDAQRIELFKLFAAYLEKVELSDMPYKYDSAGWRNLSFFESYFSNYIEGTRFTIDEAEEISSQGKALYARHEDSHDLLLHIDISDDHTEMSRVPNSAASLIDILKTRHSILLSQRRDKRPGLFKEIDNRAGGTTFVAHENVVGTLVQGFDIYNKLPAGIKRSLFMHFLIAECHPFDDGNGRMARIMMNAELVATDQYKIIVPTVCRDNYLNGLRQASRHHRFRTTVKVMHQLQQYTTSIDWKDYDDARTTLEDHAADQEPNEGLMRFNKQLSQYTGDYQAG